MCIYFSIYKIRVVVLLLMLTLLARSDFVFTDNRNIKKENDTCIQIYKAAVRSQENEFKRLVALAKKNNLDCIAEPHSDSGGDGLLHIAARKGDIKALKLFIENGFSLYAKNSFGHTFLHTAMYAEQLELVKEVLDILDVKDKALLDVHDELGDTVLHLACYRKNTELVVKLIDKGASVLKINNDFQSAKDIAILLDDMIVGSIIDDAIIDEQSKLNLMKSEDFLETLEWHRTFAGVISFTFVSSVSITALGLYLLRSVTKSNKRLQKAE